MRYCCSFVGPLARLPSAPPPALPERAEASCLALHADEVSLSAVCRLQTPPVPARTVQTRAPSPALVSAICRAASIQRAGTPSFEPASIAGRRRINAAGRCGFSGRLAPAAPRHRQPLRAALFLRLKPCVSRVIPCLVAPPRPTANAAARSPRCRPPTPPWQKRTSTTRLPAPPPFSPTSVAALLPPTKALCLPPLPPRPWQPTSQASHSSLPSLLLLPPPHLLPRPCISSQARKSSRKSASPSLHSAPVTRLSHALDLLKIVRQTMLQGEQVRTKLYTTFYCFKVAPPPPAN